MDIKSCGVEQFTGTVDEWKKTLVSGMTFWVSGNSGVFDAGIKMVTKSPWTHTGTVFQCPITGRWLVLEAQIGVNVRIGSLDFYLLGEKVPMAVGLHRDFKPEMFAAMLDFGQSELDVNYDTREIGKILIHAIAPKFVVHVDKNAFICSELEARIIQTPGLALDPQTGGNTPSSLFADSHMVHHSLYIPQ